MGSVGRHGAGAGRDEGRRGPGTAGGRAGAGLRQVGGCGEVNAGAIRAMYKPHRRCQEEPPACMGVVFLLPVTDTGPGLIGG